MKKTFPHPLLIPQQEAKNHTCENPPSVTPVVDPWHQQTEEKESQRPAANLSKNCLPINSSPAFTIVERGTNQATYSGRGTNGEAHASQI